MARLDSGKGVRDALRALPGRTLICVCVDDFRPRLMYSADQVTEYGLQCHRGSENWATPVPRDSRIDQMQRHMSIRRTRRRHAYGWEPNALDHPTDRAAHDFFAVDFDNFGLFERAWRRRVRRSPSRPGFSTSAPCAVRWATQTRSPSRRRCPIVRSRFGARCRVSASERESIALLKVAFLDIECVSPSLGFPNATCPRMRSAWWRFTTDGQHAPETSVKKLFVQPRCAAVRDHEVIVLSRVSPAQSRPRRSDPRRPRHRPLQRRLRHAHLWTELSSSSL